MSAVQGTPIIGRYDYILRRGHRVENSLRFPLATSGPRKPISSTLGKIRKYSFNEAYDARSEVSSLERQRQAVIFSCGDRCGL